MPLGPERQGGYDMECRSQRGRRWYPITSPTGNWRPAKISDILPPCEDHQPVNSKGKLEQGGDELPLSGRRGGISSLNGITPYFLGKTEFTDRTGKGVKGPPQNQW